VVFGLKALGDGRSGVEESKGGCAKLVEILGKGLLRRYLGVTVRRLAGSLARCRMRVLVAMASECGSLLRGCVAAWLG
jgi:hypothetical protein